MSVIGDLIKTTKVNEKIRKERSASDELGGSQEQLTYGPLANNLQGSYGANGSRWDMFFCDKISADIVMVYLGRMSQVYLQTGDMNLTGPIPKKIKDLLVRDYYFVHTSE